MGESTTRLIKFLGTFGRDRSAEVSAHLGIFLLKGRRRKRIPLRHHFWVAPREKRIERREMPPTEEKEKMGSLQCFASRIGIVVVVLHTWAN